MGIVLQPLALRFIVSDLLQSGVPENVQRIFVTPEFITQKSPTALALMQAAVLPHLLHHKLIWLPETRQYTSEGV
jgi:hypothetical protein